MSRVVLFRIFSLLLVLGLLVAPAAIAKPSSEYHDSSPIYKPLKTKGLFSGAWQQIGQWLYPQTTALKCTQYVAVPYPPFLVAMPCGGGVGSNLNPDGVSFN